MESAVADIRSRLQRMQAHLARHPDYPDGVYWGKRLKTVLDLPATTPTGIADVLFEGTTELAGRAADTPAMRVRRARRTPPHPYRLNNQSLGASRRT